MHPEFPTEVPTLGNRVDRFRWEDDSLGASSERTVWVGAVLDDSLLRYPLAEDGRSLALEGDLADGVDDNESKGESEGSVVGTGFGTVTISSRAPTATSTSCRSTTDPSTGSRLAEP